MLTLLTVSPNAVTVIELTEDPNDAPEQRLGHRAVWT
jgi:hypothetical protein